MAGEKTYSGIRMGDTWLTKDSLTFGEAEEFLQGRLRGANLDQLYWLEEEEDHLLADFRDKDQPISSGSPGSDRFDKDGTWGSVGGTRSDKRTEYPKP